MSQISAEANVKQLVGLFLAEIIRSRRTGIQRAAEISRYVVSLASGAKSEQEILRVLSEIESDFEEVGILKQALNFGYEPSDIKVYEQEIKEFASQLSEKDMVISANFLQDAARPHATIQQLCIRYPDFCQYLLSFSDKKELLKAFVA